MKSPQVLIGKTVPRLAVFTALAVCQKLAEHGDNPKLLALGVSEVLLAHLSGDFVIEWFHRSTDRDFESMDRVIAEAIGVICARHSLQAADVRAKWMKLAKQHRPDLQQANRDRSE